MMDTEGFDDLRIQIACSVPHGVEAAERRRVHFEAHAPRLLDDLPVRPESKIRKDTVESRPFAIPEEPVYHNERIVVLTLHQVAVTNDLFIHSTIISLNMNL